MTWYNSNRLLTVNGFSGIKTGITQTAGSCLSVNYDHKDIKLITVVLGSRSIEDRWKDTYRLTLWAAATIKTD
jgi:D-alanyl-D-alanine carboxypeptidase (penicillin-binding protein 5/6)